MEASPVVKRAAIIILETIRIIELGSTGDLGAQIG